MAAYPFQRLSRTCKRQLPQIQICPVTEQALCLWNLQVLLTTREYKSRHFSLPSQCMDHTSCIQPDLIDSNHAKQPVE